MDRRRSLGLVVGLALGASACASMNGIDRAIAELQARHDAEKLRLDRLREAIAEAERDAARAKARAELEKCRARGARVEAEASYLAAECLSRRADHQACVAGKARDKGDASLLGCVLGIGAALASGGLAAPLALGGCAVGRLLGPDEQECGPGPECSMELDDYRKEVLGPTGVLHVERCGPALGFELQDAGGELAPRHVRISGVEPGSAAELAGLTTGDELRRVHGLPVSTVNAALLVLNAIDPGTTFELGIARDGVESLVAIPTATVTAPVNATATATVSIGAGP